LKDAGGDETMLVALLVNLKNSIGLTRSPPKDLKEFAKRLKRYAKEIQRFERSTVSGVVDYAVRILDGRNVVSETVNLPLNLRHLASEVERVVVLAAKSRNVWESRALTLLEDYARDTTGAPQEAALKILSSAVLGKNVPIRVRAHRFRKIHGST
jgi:hypothetical protein